MENKTQNDFQKDILKILEVWQIKQEEFKKEVIERIAKLEDRKPEAQKENLIWVGEIESLTDPNIPQLSPEQMSQVLQSVTNEVGPILERHKVSKLEMYLTKKYE